MAMRSTLAASRNRFMKLLKMVSSLKKILLTSLVKKLMLFAAKSMVTQTREDPEDKEVVKIKMKKNLEISKVEMAVVEAMAAEEVEISREAKVVVAKEDVAKVDVAKVVEVHKMVRMKEIKMEVAKEMNLVKNLKMRTVVTEAEEIVQVTMEQQTSLPGLIAMEMESALKRNGLVP